MKLVSIEKKDSTDRVIVNPSQICSVYMGGSTCVLALTNGQLIETKFSDVNHAVDYINRAAFVAETHNYGEFRINNA
mgnify:CR=1 FL=1